MANEQASAAASAASESTATIKSGVRVQPIKPGQKIGQLRSDWAQLFRIPADAKAFCGTQELSEDATVEAGQTIEFIRKSGEKG